MSLQVRLAIGEHFLNWYTSTKLYIRGQQGKDWAVQRKMDEELFHQFNGFMEQHGLLNADKTIGDLCKQVKSLGETVDGMKGQLENQRLSLLNALGVDDATFHDALEVVRELVKEKIPPYTSCAMCGDSGCMEGEWMEGSEVECILCSKVGAATSFEHSSGHTYWMLTELYDYDDEEVE